jgi:ABC-type transporter Mla MlaB component
MFSIFSRKEKTPEKELPKAVKTASPPASGMAFSAGVKHADPAKVAPKEVKPVAAPQRPKPIDQNEAARRTTASIDAIEFEMMSAGGSAAPKFEKSGDFTKAPGSSSAARAPTSPSRSANPVGASSPSSRAPVAAAQAHEAPSTLPKLDHSTSVALGDTSGALNIDVSGTTLPPMIEEAAILFANGQINESAQSLKHAITSGELENQVQTAWVMLLDVHQATGNRAEFENTALDYAARFEASPPAWLETANADTKPEIKKSAMAATIVFPAIIDGDVVKQIEQLHKGSATKRELQIDFGNAKSATTDGADLIYKILLAFKKTKRDLTIIHADRLFDALMASLEAGRRDPSEACWLLALEMLRLMNQQQRFDDLSIDYCVTYEVSPPPWEPMPPCIKQSQGATLANMEASPKSGAEGNSFALRNELIGAIASELAALRAYSQSTSSVVIDCRELRRVDFTAAGELLNVVATLRANGKQVLFVEPNWMVLALMVVMGLHDLAEIRRRKI